MKTFHFLLHYIACADHLRRQRFNLATTILSNIQTSFIENDL